MLLHNTVNCINLRISKPILCGVLLNGVYGQLLSMYSFIALVATLSPFLHPQYKISLLLFSLSIFIPTFSIFLLSAQAPHTLSVSFNFRPRYHQNVHLLHLHIRKCDFSMECTLFCPLLQCTHDM